MDLLYEIGSEDIEVEECLVSAIPSGVATRESELLGKIVLDRISKGHPIFLSQLVDRDQHMQNSLGPVSPHKILSIEFANAQELLGEHALEPGDRISVFSEEECLFDSVRVWEVNPDAGVVQILVEVEFSDVGDSDSKIIKAARFTLE